MRVTYYRTAELPALAVWWYDDDGSLVDFSTATGWSLKIGTTPGATAALTKTTGITGAAGSGTPGNGTANVSVAWDAGELAALTAGVYVLQITASFASGDRVLQATIDVRDVLT